MTHIDASLNILALHQPSHEPTSERITSTIGIIDLAAINGLHRILIDLAILNDQRGLRPLRNYHHAALRLVLLGPIRNRMRNRLDILSLLLRPPLALRPAPSLGLIPNQHIRISQRRGQRILERDGDERRAQVQHKSLARRRGLLAQRVRRLGRHRQVEPADVEELRALRVRPDLRPPQVLHLVAVGRRQVRAQAAVLPRDHRPAPPRRHVRHHHVLGVESRGAAGLAQRLRGLVFPDGPDVQHLAGPEDVRDAPRGVLRGAAGDLDAVAGEEVVVKGHVLGGGEDGVVGFEVVFGEEGGVALGLEVQEGVLQAEELVRHDGCEWLAVGGGGVVVGGVGCVEGARVEGVRDECVEGDGVICSSGG